MLRELVQGNLPANLIIISDSLEAKGYDLFVAFLKKHAEVDSIRRIILICIENPPNFYLKYFKKYEKIEPINCLCDPCGWNNNSLQKTTIESFFTNYSDETVCFVDSLYPFVEYNGFCSIYKSLSDLKLKLKRIITIAHSEIFPPENIEQLKFLSSAFLSLKTIVSGTSEERIADVIYKKSGKVTNNTVAFSVDTKDFDVVATVKNVEEVIVKNDGSNSKCDIENLTTFKLNLQMSDNERRAKSQLVLPYVRGEEGSDGTGQIIYNPEADDLEDDPDDDLDI